MSPVDSSTPAWRSIIRALEVVGYAAVVAVALHWGARDAVASAVAFAPNAWRTSTLPRPEPLPPALGERGGFRLSIRVGTPEAELVSWVVPPSPGPAKATVLVLHGIRMQKASLAAMAVALADAGYRAVLVDLPGHGESGGRFLTYGANESLALAALLDALDEHRVGGSGVYGFSYGAAVAIELSARDRRVGAVVATSPFSSLREVTLDYERRYLPRPLQVVPDTWFQAAVDMGGELAQFDPNRAAPVRSVTRSSARLLLVHGTADTQVPLRHSLAIAEAAGERAELVKVEGATHDQMPGDATGAIRRATVTWFDRWSG